MALPNEWWIAVRADYEIENRACCNPEYDLWGDFKNNETFSYCPFCNKPLLRTIHFTPNSESKGQLIGYDLGGQKLIEKK